MNFQIPFYFLFLCKRSDVLYIELLYCTQPWIMSSEIYCTFLQLLTSRDLLFLRLFSLSASLSLSLSGFPFISLCALWVKEQEEEGKKQAQRELMTYSLLDCSTTITCTVVNSLWLNNLPFSQIVRWGCRTLGRKKKKKKAFQHGTEERKYMHASASQCCAFNHRCAL